MDFNIVDKDVPDPFVLARNTETVQKSQATISLTANTESYVYYCLAKTRTYPPTFAEVITAIADEMTEFDDFTNVGFNYAYESNDLITSIAVSGLEANK